MQDPSVKINTERVGAKKSVQIIHAHTVLVASNPGEKVALNRDNYFT